MSLYKLQINDGIKQGQYSVVLFKRSRHFFRRNWQSKMVFEGNEKEVHDFIALLCKIQQTIVLIENKSNIDRIGNKSIKTLYSIL